MTLKQLGNYFLACIIASIVGYISCLIFKTPFNAQQVFNVIACLALLRTMEK